MSSAGGIRFWAASLLAGVVVVAVGGCGEGDDAGQREAEPPPGSRPPQPPAGNPAAVRDEPQPGAVVFTRDVAPIVFAHCAPCHRPHESAPFPLLSYDDVAARGAQIVDVTADRYMPPWMPAAGHGRFQNERRLTTAQIETLRQWVAAGTPEGEPQDLPPLPHWEPGWQLGEPDLIGQMPEPYALPAGGPDVFRQVVVPLDNRRTRYVRGVELRFDNKTVVHHANVLIDTTNSSRRLDARDDEVGFEGMEIFGEAQRPNGHFLTWVPGRVATFQPRGFSWLLSPGTDIVLQLHLFPTGKPESIRATVGLHYTDEPPNENLLVLLLENRDLDIPAGEANYVLTDAFTLPVDVRALGIYPHAHLLGKRMEAWAELPDGTRTWLLKIEDWDFNWQDVYRYVEPLTLPAGTRLEMRYTFDNSAGNERNPNHPPQPVRGGDRTTDEMCHCWLQILVDSQQAYRELKVAHARHTVSRYPNDFVAQLNLGVGLIQNRDFPAAEAHFREMSEPFADMQQVHVNLAVSLIAQGQGQEAIRVLQRAERIDPNAAAVHFRFGEAYHLLGRLEESERHFQRAIADEPGDPALRFAFARLLAKVGRFDEAETEFKSGLENDPNHVDAWVGLASIAQQRGDADQAAADLTRARNIDPQSAAIHVYDGQQAARAEDWARARSAFERVLATHGDHFVARCELARTLAALGNPQGAIEQFEYALRVRPRDARVQRDLAALHLRTGNPAAAVVHLDRSLSVDPAHVPTRVMLAELLVRGGDRDSAKTHYEEALRQQPGQLRAMAGLAGVHTAAGDHREALELYRAVLEREDVPWTVQLNVAWLLATSRDEQVRNPDEALKLAARCNELSGRQNPVVIDRLAAAQAAAGQFEQAVSTAERAIDLANAAGQPALAEQIARHRDLFEAKKPLRLP